MTHKHAATAAWIGLAVITFALGWGLKPKPAVPDNGANDPRAIPYTISALPDAEARVTGGASPGSEAEIAAELGLAGSDRELSEIDIARFGADYRTALDPLDKRRIFLKLIAGMTAENAKDIREQIAHLPADHPDFRDFHFAWGKVGTDVAVMHGADTKKPDMHAALAGFASADPNAALKWFDSLPKEGSDGDFTSQSYLKMGLIHGLATADPDLAADFVLGLAAKGEKGVEKMLGAVTGKVLQTQGHLGAASWASSLPEGTMRTAATGQVAHHYARQDQQQAAAWAARLSGEAGERATTVVAHEWAKQDGAAAVGWLNQQGDSANPPAYFHTFESWVAKDPGAASQYLVDMPVSPQRDGAIRGLINRHRWDDPVSALTWANEVKDPAARQEAIINAGEAYMRKNPAEAAAWLPNSGLSAEAQAKIKRSRR